jgi:glycosyltransferase involved in cell wall biosynthesis
MMNILTLNTEAFSGGASQIATSLFHAYGDAGHSSRMLNAIYQSKDKRIQIIDNDRFRNPIFRLTQKLLKISFQKTIPILPKLFSLLLAGSEPIRTLKRINGMEDFHQPATRCLTDLVNPRPQIIHAHNLFGGYFDLRQLPRLSRQVPFILTLHDMWAFTGHCSHPLGCERWKQACGQCPHLDLPPAIPKDGSAANLAVKKRIYEKSRLYLATPSQWLMGQVNQSILKPGITNAKVILNGIDQAVFRPGEKAAARRHLNLPMEAHILLFVAAGNRSNPWKDYETLDTAVQMLANKLQGQRLILLASGQMEKENHHKNLEVRHIPWLDDKSALVHYYHASDLYLHAAHAENFPNVILESLSCGLPVIGTRTGGIPEQIQEGRNGHIVPQGDPEVMAGKAHDLLCQPETLARFSKNAADQARSTYSLERMVREYLCWFEELLTDA